MKTKENSVKTIVIDDDRNAGKRLEELLRKIDNVKILTVVFDPFSAVELVEQLTPHIIFIEIEMAIKNGFDIIREIRAKQLPVEIVIVTAQKHYAIKALKYNVFDFILKPIDFDELKNTIWRIQDACFENGNSEFAFSRLYNRSIGNEKSTPLLQNRIKINAKNGLIFHESKEIIYFEAAGSTTLVFLTNNRKVCSREYLSVVEKQLPVDQFMRISRFHIINLSSLKKIDLKSKHVILCDKENEVNLKVSRNYYKKMNEM